ncbi:MAG: hypothetical protein JKY54_11740 [Flavobacteriales bacterium]|nr:hypothetical protein [Flavobacteriales bacterium]
MEEETTQLEHRRIDDLISDDQHEWGTEQASFIGTWTNTNPTSNQIASVEVTEDGDQIYMRCFGVGPDGLIDWGISECSLYSSKVNSPVIEGFSSAFDFGFMKTMVAGNVKYGVMVIQTYNQFLDKSERNNYFSREFFCQM